MRRWASALLVAGAAFAVIPISPVSAHAGFLGSDPVDGSIVANAPRVIQLRFSEEVFAGASSATLVHLGAATIRGLAIATTNGGRTLTVALPELGRGAYILRFVAVDPADLHRTSGSVSFGVGVPAPPTESGDQIVSAWPSIVLRIVTDAALLLCLGAVVVALLVVRQRERSGVDVLRIGVASGAVVAIGWVASLVVDASTVGMRRARWGSVLLQSDPGRRALVGAQLAIGLWWSARELSRQRSARARMTVVRVIGVIAAGFVLAAAYGGHDAIGGNFAVGVALRALHLASLGIWIGAVAILWWLSRRDTAMRSLWPTVSAFAAVGLAVTGASGLLLSGRVVVNVTALLGSPYGRWVVAKGALLIVLAALGAFASRRAKRASLPKMLSLEFCIAALALVVAALLASSAPARGDQFLALPSTSPQIVTADVRDLTVSTSIEPARPGLNVVNVVVLETRRPSPGPVTNVVMRLVGADGTTVAQRNGSPVAGSLEWNDINIPRPGTYRVQLGLVRSASSVPDFAATWSIDRAPVPRVRRVLSTRTWAPIAAALAAFWIVLIALVRMTYYRAVRTTDADERRGPSSHHI